MNFWPHSPYAPLRSFSNLWLGKEEIFTTTGGFIMGQLMILVSIYYPPMHLLRAKDPSNLVISYTLKTDLNVTEMHELHRYYFSWYLNLKGGMTIFRTISYKRRVCLTLKIDFVSKYIYCIKEKRKSVYNAVYSIKKVFWMTMWVCDWTDKTDLRGRRPRNEFEKEIARYW